MAARRDRLLEWDVRFQMRGVAGRDIFLHGKQITRGNPRVGALVMFELVEVADHRKKSSASNAEILS
jgi:hypothetical protein